MAHAQSTAALNQLLINSGIALAIMAVLSIWLGWLVAGRALRPLRTITNAARDISASSLHRRLALDGPDDELTQLGNTFDELLERLEASFEAQRQFAANASHELRTPLTLERTLVEVALADPGASLDSLRQMGERVLAAGEQQERLIEALLTLSRSQRGIDHHERIDLAATTAQVLPTLATNELTVTTSLQPAWASGDPQLVERLIANLLTNAVSHNTVPGHIEVRTETRAGRALLMIENTGPPIPADRARPALRTISTPRRRTQKRLERIRSRPLHRPGGRDRPSRHDQRRRERWRRPADRGRVPGPNPGRRSALTTRRSRSHQQRALGTKVRLQLCAAGLADRITTRPIAFHTSPDQEVRGF